MSRSLPTSFATARTAALAAISDVFSQSRDLQSALHYRLQSTPLKKQDVALCTELVYGFFRHFGRIDFILSKFLVRPSRLPPNCLHILRLATYERLFLDRVPDYATRSWAVTLIGKRFTKGLSSLASAYLTFLQNHTDDLTLPDFFRRHTNSLSQFSSAYYSLPSWIVELWFSAYGEEHALRLFAAQLNPALIGLRINPKRSGVAELIHRIVDSPDVQRSGQWGLAGSKEVLRRLFHDMEALLGQGLVSRQSLASQHILHALDIFQCKGLVWDVCAGRGGKTCLILEQSDFPVFASDINFWRLNALRAELRRLGIDDIPVISARADQALPWKECPSCILIDAPCSGLGVLSRRPDLKWKRLPKDLPSLTTLQRAMIRTAATQISSGGRIIYITCTLNPAENENQIADILDDPGLKLRCLNVFDGSRDFALGEFFWGAVLEKK